MQQHMSGDSRGYNGYIPYNMHQQPQGMGQHSQQRPPMPSMVGRSQSGGMPMGGDYMNSGPPMQQRQSSYGGMPSNQGGMGMNMGGGMYQRMGGDMMGGGGGLQMGMGYGQQRTMPDSSMQYDNTNFSMLHGQPQQLRIPSSVNSQIPGPHLSQGGLPPQREEEFTIHSEEFPALPSSQGKSRTESTSSTNEEVQQHSEHPVVSQQTQGQQHQQGQHNLPRQAGSSPSFPRQASPLIQPQSIKSPPLQPSAGLGEVGTGFGSVVGNMPLSSSANVPGNSRSNSGNPPSRPPSVPASPRLMGSESGPSGELKYGLMGLLDVINMTNKDMNYLSLGSDLTTFGLNLNSVDNLYTTFSGPFADQTAASETQFTTPQCYLMHSPSLKPEHLSKFQLETLFYMFYAMPRDVLQTTSAVELYRREWRYHGELRVWFKSRSPQEQIQGHPGVQYVYFDISSWEVRLFTSATRAPLASGFLTAEEIRQKPQSHPSTSGPTSTS